MIVKFPEMFLLLDNNTTQPNLTEAGITITRNINAKIWQEIRIMMGLDDISATNISDILAQSMLPDIYTRLEYHYQRGNQIIGVFENEEEAYQLLGYNIGVFILTHTKKFSALYSEGISQFSIKDINNGKDIRSISSNRTKDYNSKAATTNSPVGADAFTEITTPFSKSQSKSDDNDTYTETNEYTQEMPTIELYEKFASLNSFTEFRKQAYKFIDSLCLEYITLF